MYYSQQMMIYDSGFADCVLAGWPRGLMPVEFSFTYLSKQILVFFFFISYTSYTMTFWSVLVKKNSTCGHLHWYVGLCTSCTRKCTAKCTDKVPIFGNVLIKNVLIFCHILLKNELIFDHVLMEMYCFDTVRRLYI